MERFTKSHREKVGRWGKEKKDACVTNQGRAPKALLFFNQSDKSPDFGLRADVA